MSYARLYVSRLPLLLLTVALFAGCETELEDLEPATFPTNGDVFIDGFTSGLNYAAFGGSDPRAFDTDTDEVFDGTTSMRYSVPDFESPRGAYAGGSYFLDVGRDLSGYNTLTFWARATKAANLDIIGFGNDLDQSTYLASVGGLAIGTTWRKYYIPIPDPSKLTQERGMLFYSEGPEDQRGYTFWIDEVQFENVGTIGEAQPFVFNGEERVVAGQTGERYTAAGYTEFNLPTGVNQRVATAPSYFDYQSSDTTIAVVDASGTVTVRDSGMAVITATLAGVEATGSLTISSAGRGSAPTQAAPTPQINADDVISLYSDAYVDEPVDFYNGFWDGSSTQSEFVDIQGDSAIRYSQLNFVGIQFTEPTINITGMTHVSVDIWTPDDVDASKFFKIKLFDVGPDGAFGTADDTEFEPQFTTPQVRSNEWVTLDLPLSQFPGVSGMHLAQVVLSGDFPNVYMDNLFFYNDGGGGGGGGGGSEPTVAAPTPTQAQADVISLFSDAYTDVPVDIWRTTWSEATFEDVMIAGNAAKKYTDVTVAGIETVMNQIDATGMTHFRVDVWTPNATALGIKLVDFGADGAFDGGDDVEQQLDFASPAQGEWISYDLPLSDFTALTTTANMAQYIFTGQPAGTTTFYLDNLYFYDANGSGGGGGGGGVEPTVAAPTPTIAEVDVISLFSDAYTDVAVDTWRTPWSSAIFSDTTIAGNAVKKYRAVDVIGIETAASQVDATGMTHFRVDVWTPDATLMGLKLVDFGADGGFGGGDDVEQQLDFANPTQGQWVTYDLPLSDFTALTTRANMAQYIFTGQPTGASTLYLDNMFFYDANGSGGGGGGGGVEPTVAAPTPTVAEADVISLFSDAYTDVAVDTWRTPWSSAIFSDTTIAGNAVKKYRAVDVIGIETAASQIDASGMTHFRVDVWTPDATLMGLKLVDFGADGGFGGGDDVEQQLDFANPAQGQWVTYDLPLSDFTALTTRSNMAQYIFTGQPTGASILYLDNMFFYNDGSGGGGGGGGGAAEPTVAAPTPMVAEADVISLFSDAYTDVAVDTWRTPWSSAVFSDTTIAGNAVKKYRAVDVIGIETAASQIDASGMTHFRVDVWTPDATLMGLKLVDFGADGGFGGGDDVEQQLDFANPAQGQWVTYDLPLSDFTALTMRSNMAQYIFTGQPSGASILYLDNIFFYNDGSGGGGGGGGGAAEPTVAAPTPMVAEADVISLFSDAYTDVSVDTWRTPWSSAIFSDTTIAGNAVKKYRAVDVIGIETAASQIDASGMTHFRVDVWTPDATLMGLKLVDFGADGGFGGGDDVEQQLDFANPSQGQWVTYDLPLSDFTALSTRSNMAQYIFTGQPSGASILYLDNIFFYNDGSGGGGGGGGGGGMNIPAAAAPTPTRPAANVISLFSDAYTNVPVDTWRTPWSSPTVVLTDTTLAGDAVKRYTGVDVFGVETTGMTVDVTTMTHVHFDVWSPNATDVNLKLVDFGADGGFGGGDDVEHQVDNSGVTQGEWVAFDIPLSDFVGLTTRSNMAQYIFVGRPLGTATLWLDNVYFYTE